MPSMTEHESHSIVKALCAADSGAGKTGALACLVDAGYNLRILDFDNGVSVLRGYIKDKSKLANVHYLPLFDELKLQASRVGISKAAAFQRAVDALDKGGDAWGAGSKIPPLNQWGPKDILCLDTLSSAGRASLQMVMQMNGKGFSSPEIQHYGIAMENIEKLIAILTSAGVGCNVIVNTHITNAEGTAKLYPEALGSKLSPKIGRYFDNMVSLSVTAGKRTFKTSKDGMFALKTASPVQETYDIEQGWVQLFKALTGKKDLMEGL